MAPLLELTDVVAGYGAGDILKGVSLSIEDGAVTCLIGPNGAGKSTVLKTVSGLLRPSRGRVAFRGEPVDALSPRERLLRGIAHVPQERSLFPAMTVWDNLLMGGYLIRDSATVARRLEAAVARLYLGGGAPAGVPGEAVPGEAAPGKGMADREKAGMADREKDSSA